MRSAYGLVEITLCHIGNYGANALEEGAVASQSDLETGKPLVRRFVSSSLTVPIPCHSHLSNGILSSHCIRDGDTIREPKLSLSQMIGSNHSMLDNSISCLMLGMAACSSARPFHLLPAACLHEALCNTRNNTMPSANSSSLHH